MSQEAREYHEKYHYMCFVKINYAMDLFICSYYQLQEASLMTNGIDIDLRV